MRHALIITDVTAPGGVDTYVADLCVAARERGWSPHLLMDEGEGSVALARRIAQIGVPFMRRGLYHRAYDEAARRGATLEALAWATPHVVHAACGAPWTTVVPREIALDAGLPLVFVEQYVAKGFTFTPDLRARIRDLYRRAHAVIAVSAHNAALLRGYGFDAKDRLHVIPNSVTQPAVPRVSRDEAVRRFELPRREFQAVCVARLHRQKGIDVLIAALARLEPAVRARFHVVVLGDGPDRDALAELAATHRVTDTMSFAGWCDDPRAATGAFDLFVLPSRSEGQPFALLEAMADGVPVIACAAGGIPEALDDGRVGMLVPVEDAAALARAIEAFVADPTAARDMSLIARDFVREHYDARTNLNRTIDLWEAGR
ncbi:MAG: glycosyltransferase [Deltaproteobacteria bacterium]|nr:glycosyltransferase [Deltaproteobacteria bacterium]